jgi:hypothetical protein
MQQHPREFVLWRLVCAAFALLILNCLGPAYASDARAEKYSTGSGAPLGRVAGNYGQVPLSFEPNPGQSDANVKFLARGSGYSLFLTPGEAVLSLERSNSAAADTLRMKLLGANTTARATGVDMQAGVINYFVGNDAKKWHTGIPTYGKVNFAGIYPGIDLVFYGNQRQLEYDFVVKPGGDSSRIAWSVRGAQPRLGKDGSLELNAAGYAPGGAVRFLAPVAFQVLDGERRPVAVSYAVGGETVRFALGDYDHKKTLIIDPVLSYFSYLGGTGNDYIGNSVNQGVGSPSPEPTQAAGIDAQGNLYVAGNTSSSDFPVAVPVSIRKTKNAGQTWAFVSKFSPDGSKLLYSTYIGGSAGGNDAARALAVDSTGNAYVTGAAQTNDFPVTAGAFQTVCAPMWDNLTNAEAASCTSSTQNAFALKLTPTGSKLIYSSFLGGQGGTWGTGMLSTRRDRPI